MNTKYRAGDERAEILGFPLAAEIIATDLSKLELRQSDIRLKTLPHEVEKIKIILATVTLDALSVKHVAQRRRHV